MEETASLRFLKVFFDRMLLILAGRDAIHKSLNELEIWPDPSMYYGVICL